MSPAPHKSAGERQGEGRSISIEKRRGNVGGSLVTELSYAL